MEIPVFDDIFQTLLKPRPFEPFVIELDNGNSVEIRHPESLLVDRAVDKDGQERVLLIYSRMLREGIHMFETSAITQIRDVDEVEARSA